MGPKSLLTAVAGVLVLGLGAGGAQAAASAAPVAKAAAPAAATPAPAKAAMPSCNRACLEDLANQYFSALVAHNAKQLPLAKGVRYTENNVTVKLNDGLWATAESVDPAKLWVTDAKTHQVLVYTGVKEAGQLGLLGVRLRAEGRKIKEIEVTAVRKYNGAASNAFEKLDALLPFPALWNEPVAADNKTPRATMAKVASLYFDGIEQSNGDIVPFQDGNCVRYENVAQAAGRAGTPSCREQFSSGRFHYITEVTNRRCDLDDEVRGIAICIVHFQHPGTIRTWTDKKTGQVNPIGGNLSKYPNITYIWEGFKVENGHYLNIVAYVNPMNYRQPPGWPPTKPVN